MSDLVSADGSPVEAYAAFPAEPELGIVLGLLAGRHRVLDLGCGTGRLADPLAQAGFDVVAVDESEHMLGHVQHASALRGSIEELSIGRRFDAVLLLSQLINGANAAALLEVAARHLDIGGLLVAQRLVPGQQWRAGSSTQLGAVTVGLVDVAVESSRVDASTSYELEGRRWIQRWTLWERDDKEIAAMLHTAGLRLVTADEAWITASR